MCGIAGMLLLPGESVDNNILAKMGSQLIHRGPDNTGLFSYKNIGFVHTRLSIIDLTTAGNQPFHNNRYTLVYNGEIYNYIELSRDLKEYNIQFRSSSDTEILFYYLIIFGVEKTLTKLRGMFAFSFFDHERNILYLCRDRLGIKPLFWISRNNRLYFASEVKALMPVVSLEPDPVKSIFTITGLGDKSNYYTIFKGIYHVPPGSFLMIKPGEEPIIKAYYDLTQEIHEPTYRQLDRLSLREAADQLCQLIRRSVKRMLMSDAPMGAFVSGGLDSSFIAFHAVQQDQELSLFTANVLGEYSEVSYARCLAKALNKPLFEAIFSPDMMLHTWAVTTYHYEVPIVTHTNSFPFAEVAKLARQQGVKAVLTGEGADELFMGYPNFKTIPYLKYLALPANLVKRIYGLVPKLHDHLFPSAGRRSVDFLELLVQDFERQSLRERGHEAFAFLSPKARERQYLTIQMLREGLISLLHRNDRMGMLASIESRFPYLDEEIIHFGINLPFRFKNRLTYRFHDRYHPFLIDKAVLRKAAEHLLPIEIVGRRKEGFPIYGHRFIYIKPGFFKNGYIADITGLTPRGEQYMLENESSYFTGKLASVEIFGRLFAYQENVNKVTEHILRYISISEKLQNLISSEYFYQ